MFFAENPETLQQKVSIESLRDRLVQASSKLATIAVAPLPQSAVNNPGAVAGAANTAVAPAASSSKGVPPSQQQQQSASVSGKLPSSGISGKTPTSNAAVVAQNSVRPSSSQPQSSSSAPLSFQLTIGDSGLGLVLNVTSTGTHGSGVYVKEFGPNSPCIAVGVRVGDRILSINDVPVADIDAVRNVIKSSKGSLKIQVLR